MEVQEGDVNSGLYPPGDTVTVPSKPRCGRREYFACDDCDKTFSTGFSLRRHRRSVHLKEKPFQCTTCGLTFSLKPSLTRHVNDVHLGKRAFLCKDCGATFSRAGALSRHIKRLHAVEAPTSTKLPSVNTKVHSNSGPPFVDPDDADFEDAVPMEGSKGEVGPGSLKKHLKRKKGKADGVLEEPLQKKPKVQ